MNGPPKQRKPPGDGGAREQSSADEEREHVNTHAEIPEMDLLGADDSPGNGDRAGQPLEVFTQLEAAKRLAVGRFGEDVRYIYAWQRFVAWDGKRWTLDRPELPERLAKKSARQRTLECLDDVSALREAAKLESEPAIRGTLRLVASESGIPVKHTTFDSDPMVLNLANGILDLRTGKLGPHRKDAYCMKLAPVAYEPNAECPLWNRVLERIFPDAEVRGFLRRFLGYSLTGDVGEQVLAFFYGLGANGKSVVLLIMQWLLGDYAHQAPAGLLIQRKHESHPTQLAGLNGRRFVTSIETGQGEFFHEALVKQLTGGDRLTARRMREDFWSFDPTHKLVISSNHRPNIRGTDEAIWRRICLVPFVVTIPPEQRDPKLVDKLKAEGPGILRWLVDGCLQWQRDGLAAPTAVKAATAAYRASQDKLGRFLSACCIEEERAMVAKDALFKAFKSWCGSEGERMITKKALTTELSKRGFDGARLGATRTGTWLGLGLFRAES